MGDTKIEWTRNADGTPGKTWNPIRARNKVTGKVGWFCEHVSEGCRNCYAEKMNRNTYFGNGLDYKPAELDQVELFLDEKILQQPLHWRKPTMVFPCSMTDLFGRWVKDEWLDKIHHVMWRASQHTYQCLTKRADRMLDYMRDPNTPGGKPLTNVWLGVSVEDQKTADERIPLLLQTPAAVRWISAEPLLGPVDRLLSHVIDCDCSGGHDQGCRAQARIGWVVCGGESGPNARPMHPDWARSIRDQCLDSGVPFFFKQWGEWQPRDQYKGAGMPLLRNRLRVGLDGDTEGPHGMPITLREPRGMYRVGKKAAGRLLDGKEWNEFPATTEAR